ncbi:MAG: sialate O-acetylesterase [Planctomycetota bacterium]|nr:sialate O-acetylesterase [Planctomycetota bacterium]
MLGVRFFPLILALTLWLTDATAATCMADVKLPNIFNDHMVIQRQQPIRVFGTAEPGEKVTVEFAGESGKTEANADGKWRVQLPAVAADRAPREMIIRGNNTITLSDILVGDVWLCSGQSNMEWHLRSSADARKEIEAANYPEIRLFDVTGHTVNRTPQSNTSGQWERCVPKTARSFSAVAYFFGRSLYRETNIPVGLIGTNWGGTKIEPWIPRVGFDNSPPLEEIKNGLKELDLSTPEGKARHNAYVSEVKRWSSEAAKRVKAGEHPGNPPAPPSFSEVQGATTIYNAMVHGIAPFSVRGAIWYQGESNGEEGEIYFHKMKALIAGWRKMFENPKMLFYFVQLANWQAPTEDPAGGDGWSLIREAQRKTLEIPYTGMAVIIDIGEAGDIHPRNKQDVGARLARWGLRDVYGKETVPSGPLLKSAVPEGSTMRITFDHVGQGLMVGKKSGLEQATEMRGAPLQRFAVAGKDRIWHWANASIDGDSVVVSSPQVKAPVAVRYAFSMNPEGANLYNRDGLPASPFRTDDWEIEKKPENQ